MEFIKRCPFCGSMPRICNHYNDKKKTFYVFVQCTSCWARSMTIKTDTPMSWDSKIGQQVITAWNKRVNTDDETKEINDL